MTPRAWLLLALLVAVILYFQLTGDPTVLKAEFQALATADNAPLLNPMDVKPPANAGAWQGQVGVDARGLCGFDTLDNGMRAGAISARYQFLANPGLSLVAFGNPYAEQAPGVYGAHLGRVLGVDATAPYPHADPQAFQALCRAVVQLEQGQAVSLALSPLYAPAQLAAFNHVYNLG